jgi:spermidine/putrescine transport system ATP-binding protein
VAIDCRDLVKTFAGGTVRALDGVSLGIRANEFFTLLGPSGCGKTTLLRCIAGFETQDTGSIALHGERLDGLPPYRRPVNTVFQSYAVFPHMTVAENVAFGLEMKRMGRRDIAARVAEMLALVKLEGMAGRRPAQLSGGQQQRVALARALATAPKVLLLDEPLSALDLKLRTEMQVELKRLQAEVGITFVFVTHDQHEALTMSDRIAVMEHGRVLQVGTPEDVYERPVNRFVADFIGDTNLLAARRIAPGRYAVDGVGELRVTDDVATTGPATLAVRPERAELCAPGEGMLEGVVEHVAYLGTDTTYHLRLGALPFRVRLQNRDGVAMRLQPGERVGLRVAAAAVRVLGG